MWKRALLLVLLACAGAARAQKTTGVPEILAREAETGIRSEVLVVGTAHLAELASPPGRTALAPVLAALDRYRPTVICVEHLPARDIAEMDLRGGTFREVARMFASHDLRLGPLARAALSCTREEAAARAEELLARTAPLAPGERRELVANLVAAYELPTALLQWSLLPEAERRAGPGLPKDVASHLDRTLASANETSSIAVPLARAAGLARLVSVDSQWDGARLLQQPEDAIEEAFGHPARKPASEPEEYAVRKKLIEEAPLAASLLPLFSHLNSQAFGAADVRAQWGSWLRLRLASGLDRMRYGNWEARNAAIVAHLAEVTASPCPERVLLLIGAAHKPFVEDLLGRLVHVKVARFEDLIPPG